MALRNISPDALEQKTNSLSDWFLIDVWAHHCASCKGVEQLLELMSPDLPAYCHVMKLCADDFPDWIEKKAIRTVPMLLLIHNGQEIARQHGDLSTSVLKMFLEQHLSAKHDPEAYVEMLLENERLDDLATYLQTLKDEQSRGPSVQRARSWLSMMNLPLDEHKSPFRDNFFKMARSGDWQCILDLLTEAIQSDHELRSLVFALADLIPDRPLVSRWRRAMK